MALGGAIRHIGLFIVSHGAGERLVELVGDLREHLADVLALLVAHVLRGVGQLLCKLFNVHRYSFSNNRSCLPAGSRTTIVRSRRAGHTYGQNLSVPAPG